MIALVLMDIGVVIAASVIVGAWAPRWPARWLTADPVPLRLSRVETAARYRRLGVTTLARRMPELGSTFGGESKSALPGASRQALAGYLMEVRRAEWVHWASIASTLVLFAFNPWWLALAFVVAVTVGNLPFIIILRHNRLRLLSVLGRDQPPSWNGNPS